MRIFPIFTLVLVGAACKDPGSSSDVSDLEAIADLGVMLQTDLAKTTDLVFPPDLVTLSDFSSLPDMVTTDQLVANQGTLEVSVVALQPPSQNYLMGARGQYPAVYNFAAKVEKMIVTGVVASFFCVGPDADRVVGSVTLVDVDTQQAIGQMAFPVAKPNGQPGAPGYVHAAVRGLNWVVLAGTTKQIAFKVDFVSYQDGFFQSTGQSIVPAILVSYTNTPGINAGVTVMGGDSGNAITPTIKTELPAGVVGAIDGAHAATATVYRTKLTVAWSNDTPSGAASPSPAQTIGKFVVVSQANAGNYSANIEVENLEFSRTFLLKAPRSMNVHRNSLATAPIASYTFMPGPLLRETSNIKPVNFNAGTGVEIASGQFITFFATFDSSDAGRGVSLSTRVPIGGIVWSDGVSKGITAMGEDLPIVYKTFTY